MKNWEGKDLKGFKDFKALKGIKEHRSHSTLGTIGILGTLGEGKRYIVSYKTFWCSFIQKLPTLYLLYNTEPNDQGFERWRYEYYTGYVHCPLNGIREVEDLKLHNLPMQTVEATRLGFSEQRLGFGYEE